MTNRQKLDRKISTLRIEQQEARKAINDDEQDEAKRAEGTARYESLSDQLIEHERASASLPSTRKSKPRKR